MMGSDFEISGCRFLVHQVLIACGYLLCPTFGFSYFIAAFDKSISVISLWHNATIVSVHHSSSLFLLDACIRSSYGTTKEGTKVSTKLPHCFD